MSLVAKINPSIFGFYNLKISNWFRFSNQTVLNSYSTSNSNDSPSDKQHKKNRNFFLQTTPYMKLNKEERQYLTSEIYQRSVILGIPEFDDKKIQDLKSKINPNLEPFSQIYQDSGENENFCETEVLTEKNPHLWYWVERLLPKEDKATYINLDRKKLPSGYIPPPKVPPNLPYFVSRTRGGLFPVYKTIEKTNRVLTVLKKVDGDIWKAEQSLRNFLETMLKEKIITSVNEPKKVISLKKNYVFQVIEWLKHKGF